jgi:hypothetical protein
VHQNEDKIKVINLWQDYGDGVARQKGQTTYDNINKEVD